MMAAPATWPAKRVTFSAHPVIFGGETTTGHHHHRLPQSPSLPCVIRWTTSLEMNCRQDKPLIHSNSTSHLHFRDPRRQQPLEDARKRFSSTEGRFSIIDEQSKDASGSSESDEDTPLPHGFKAPQRVATTPSFSQSLPHGHPHMASAASVSRFRIVPVESRYKRGRWECFDYYQKELPRNSKASCPGPPRTLSNLHQTDRTVRSWTTELSPAPATAPPTSKTSTFHFEETPKNSSLKHKVLNVDVAQGRMTPTEMLQTGLESTLNTAEIKKKENIKGVQRLETTCLLSLPVDRPPMRRRFISNSTATNHNGNSPSTVAIDSKIEQAMDLVKSHLMFAVREEVEGLRQKIGELETHIQHLESENAILRGHVPPDVLGQGLHVPK